MKAAAHEQIARAWNLALQNDPFALSLAGQAGSHKAVNVVLIGAMVRFMELRKELFESAVRACVAERFLAMNQKAFEAGYQSV